MSVPLYVLQEQSERMDIVYAMRREAFTPEQDNRAKHCIAEVRAAIEKQQQTCEAKRQQAIRELFKKGVKK